MRYTTLIDISEIPTIYNNLNARLLYLHMALRSGYHDNDRDQLKCSLRRLADAAGLTLSATRHALGLLEREKLITRTDHAWQVKKWINETPPTPRSKKGTAAAAAAGNIGERYEKEIQEYQLKVNNAIRSMSKEEIITWLEELKDGKCLRHHGVSINPTQRNIDWLTNVIKKL